MRYAWAHYEKLMRVTQYQIHTTIIIKITHSHKKSEFHQLQSKINVVFKFWHKIHTSIKLWSVDLVEPGGN